MSNAAVSGNIADAVASKDAACMPRIRISSKDSAEAAANKISATVAVNRDILETGARNVGDGAGTNTGILDTAASKVADGAAPSMTMEATAAPTKGICTAVALMAVGIVIGFVVSSIFATMSVIPATVADFSGITGAGSDSGGRSGCTKLGVLTALGGATVAVVGAPFVLPALGFGAGGVAAGSAAAAAQGVIGNVAAGSIFASLQSAGAAGLAMTTKMGLGLAGGAVGAAVDCLSDAWAS